MSIHILLADSHTVPAIIWSRFLQDQEDIEVVGLAEDGLTTIDLTRQLAPEIILLDLDVALVPYRDLVQRIHRERPGVKIIILSIERVSAPLWETFQGAVSGYLLKNCDPQELLAAVRMVAEGGTYEDPDADCRRPDDPPQGM